MAGRENLSGNQDRRHSPPLDGKKHSVEVYYRDYRRVGSLIMPYVVETKVEGVRQTEKIEIEKIAVNPHLEDSRFAKLQ